MDGSKKRPQSFTDINGDRKRVKESTQNEEGFYRTLSKRPRPRQHTILVPLNEIVKPTADDEASLQAIPEDIRNVSSQQD
jgi:hypothetical protein